MRPLAAALLLGLCAPQLSAQTGENAPGAPLSAIDWLSRSVETPAAAPPREGDLPSAGEAPVADSATVPEITVRPLDGPSPDRVGLLPPSVTGLPRDLWTGSEVGTVTDLLRAERVDSVPAIRDLMKTLLLAEAEAPASAEEDGLLFLARVDKLLDLGALDPALELLEAADPETAEMFRRYFDVTLLTGDENRACRLMDDKPEVAPTLPARIFCLARSGDWAAAALTLNTARAIGDVSDAEDALLARFLDPDLFHDADPLPAPDRPSPLVFRMREAIGQPLSTVDLPRAFAHADLRDTVGWKAQLEAAERLARTGAIDDNRLLGLYTERQPAASGGVWDRAAAIQRLDQALVEGDAGAISNALPQAWEAARSARIEVPFARLFAERLLGVDLGAGAAQVAYRIGLLSDEYESYSLDLPAAGENADFLAGIARGAVSGEPPEDMLQASIHAAFADAPPPERLMELAGDARLGEALLRAMAMFDMGAAGDPGALTEALSFLRAVGLEDTARRAALQLMILDRIT